MGVRRLLPAAVAVVTSLLLWLLGACTGPPTSVSPSTIAVVVAHHDTELPPALSDAEHARFRALATSSDDAVVTVLAAGDPAVEQVDLAPRRPNGQVERGPRRDELIEQRLAALDTTIDRAAARSRSTDVLGALGSAVRSGASEIHLLSAGLSGTDPFDMRVSGWDVDPQHLAATLRAAHALPDATGRSVVLSGLGRTTGRQPTLDEAAQQSLRAQWTAVCAATGARCIVDDGPRPLPPDVPAPLPGPVVPVPRTGTHPTPGGGSEVSLPSAVLFLPGSCARRDRAAAQAVVEGAAEQLRSGSTASVSGRTAPVGPGDGIGLASCRADAVADLLIGVGVPRSALTRVAGDGSLADPPSASRDARGRPDPTTYPGLRRVVLDLTPAARP
jgi:outer membrane protein OmpA-like peptidoglycan-associated protein